MGFGTPGVNLHAPGPIGDTTPSTLAGTTLNLTSTAVQLQLYYDGTHRNTLTTGSGGQFILNQLDVTSVTFQAAGAEYFAIRSGGILATASAWFFSTSNADTYANRAKFCVQSVPGLNACGIGDGGASGTTTIVTNDIDRVAFSTTLMTGISMGIQWPLPTSDPHVVGRWWSNLGLVTISAG